MSYSVNRRGLLLALVAWIHSSYQGMGPTLLTRAGAIVLLMCSTACETPRRNNHEITDTVTVHRPAQPRWSTGVAGPEAQRASTGSHYSHVPRTGLSSLAPQGSEPHQSHQGVRAVLVQDHALGRPAAHEDARSLSRCVT